MPLPLGGEHGLPYSRGLMARALMAVGVAPERAYALARRVGVDVGERGSDVVELGRLETLAVEILGEVEGTEALRQLRRYQELRELDLPLVILIGGGTGTGKSTVATEIAYRLGITRVTSTDFIRQTMRAFFSHEFMPAIHYSSFEAGDVVPLADDPLIAGFLEQSRDVLVGVRASIERALQEGWSMVLEGVHLVPGLLPTVREGALLSACVLNIRDEAAHAQHFFSREGDGAERPMAKYLDRFDEIRRLQSYPCRACRARGCRRDRERERESCDGGGCGARAVRRRTSCGTAYERHRGRADTRRDAGDAHAAVPLPVVSARDGARRARCGPLARTRRSGGCGGGGGHGHARDARRAADPRPDRLRRRRRRERSRARRTPRRRRPRGRSGARSARRPRRGRARRQTARCR